MEAKRSKTKLVVSLLALGSTLTFLAFCMAGDSDMGMPTVLESGISLQAQLISSVPLTISQSGSYYLDQNMTHTNRYTNAIQVNADNVTIDLAGYSLIGPSSSSGTSSGIRMNGRKNVEIRNGTVTNFGNNGIWDEDTGDTSSGHRVIDVRVLSNGGNGIVLEGNHNLVKDCTVLYNCSAIIEGWGGIRCGHTSTIIGNVVSYTNFLAGISADIGCTISGNNVSDNGWGINAWRGCHIIGNTCTWDMIGIFIEGNGNLVKGNTIFNSEDNGIEVGGSYNAIEENLVTDCSVGIFFSSAQNFYANNRVMNNSTNYGGSVPSGSKNGGGNIAFGILAPNSINAELEMYEKNQTMNRIVLERLE
ncbi:right-handed parallel beta-helix repeat-containing protein [Planctomycetota bacterium]